jgi:DNA-binding transcriptional MerR regulator
MQMLEEQLNTQISNLTMNLGAAGLSPEQIERIQRRAREASERAARRAEEKMRQAQERLERRLAATQQRMQQKARAAEAHARHREQRPGFGWQVAPVEPPSPVQEPVSDEERLTVLRLLEQKKITLEEAEALLAALEGKEG